MLLINLSTFQQTGGPDQRSQSSKGAMKTSPRSSRSKHAPGHSSSSHRDQRALSQERALSASWTAGHAPGGHGHYPAPVLDDSRRKMEAAPPHQATGWGVKHYGGGAQSNNSTLKKGAASANVSRQASNPSEVTVAGKDVLRFFF